MHKDAGIVWKSFGSCVQDTRHSGFRVQDLGLNRLGLRAQVYGLV